MRAVSDAVETGGQPKSVRRVLQILEAVAELGPGVAAVDIARHAGMSRAAAYRILNVLVADGYLVRVPDLSGFALGGRTAKLGQAADRTDLSASVQTVMTEIRAQVRVGVYLSRFDGGRIRFVDRDPDHELVGERVMLANPHATAVGKVFLAYLEPLLDDVPRRQFTPHTIVEVCDLREELRNVVASGIAADVDEFRRGRASLAVPVRNAAGAVAGALSATGATGSVSILDAGLVDVLRQGAGRLARLI